jgi:hypothetical protein
LRRKPGSGAKKPDNLIPLSLRIEPETLEQLQRPSTFKLGLRPISDDIRKRLKWTLDIAPMDDPTREFLKDVALLAAEVANETGSEWHTHPGAHLAFRQAILSRLARLRPQGDDVMFGPRPHRTGPSNDPQEIGIWAEHDINLSRKLSRKERENYRQTKEASWQDIVRLHGERTERQP